MPNSANKQNGKKHVIVKRVAKSSGKLIKDASLAGFAVLNYARTSIIYTALAGTVSTFSLPVAVGVGACAFIGSRLLHKDAKKIAKHVIKRREKKSNISEESKGKIELAAIAASSALLGVGFLTIGYPVAPVLVAAIGTKNFLAKKGVKLVKKHQEKKNKKGKESKTK